MQQHLWLTKVKLLPVTGLLCLSTERCSNVPRGPVLCVIRGVQDETHGSQNKLHDTRKSTRTKTEKTAQTGKGMAALQGL